VHNLKIKNGMQKQKCEMINENKSSCYPEIEPYKQEVCSPYNELPFIGGTNSRQENKTKIK